MPTGTKALVESGQGRVMASSNERSHVEDPAYGAPAPPDHAPAPQRAAVLVAGRDAHQGGDLPAVEPPQFRKFGDERGGGDRAPPGHGREQIHGFPPRWAGTDRVMQIRLE